MQVWQLNRCEEYWMQEDHGIFATKERAIAEVTEKVLLTVDGGKGVILITVESEHYAHPNEEKIVTRGGVEVTEKNVMDYMRSYEFYDVCHAGYNIWGVSPVTVKE